MNNTLKKADALLVGRVIVKVRWMTEEEAAAMYWDKRGPVLQLDDGTLLIATADDEGNNAGVLTVQSAGGNYDNGMALGTI